MIAFVVAVALWTATANGAGERTVPASIVVATARGEAVIQVAIDRGHPALPVPQLSQILPVRAEISNGWALIEFARQPFRFLLDAPVFAHRERTIPLVGGAYVVGDTVFVPLQWLTDYIPKVFREGYRYDPYAARFEEARLTPVVTRAPPSEPPRYRRPAPGSAAARNGFRIQHQVVVDAGHGGRDVGNPGLYFPKGIREKHITLAIAKLIRGELRKQGVEVLMTRDRDRHVNLRDRARKCSDRCALFVSIHINSLKSSPGYRNVGGMETYFLDEARTAEAARVAKMENEAVRYDAAELPEVGDELSFILKDLQANEYLRESALLADLIQRTASRVHPGESRGVAQARFLVLSAARRPAVLVEAGFATNRKDATFLASAEGQRMLATTIAGGILQYLRQYETKVLAGEPG